MKHVTITLHAQIDADIADDYIVALIRKAVGESPAADAIVITRGSIEEVS